MKETTGLFFVAIIIATVIGVALSNLSVAYSQGRATASAVESIARQPEASGKITIALLLGLAMMEALTLYVFILALILYFANPFIKFIVH